MEGPGSSGFRFVAEREVHRGHLWSVTVATFESPDGVEFVRDVVRSPGAVAVVPVLFDAEGLASVVLVEQYRPPFDELVVEAPAGMRDVPGERPEATAHRELAEEVGLRAGSMELLTVVYPSPGMTDATTTIFLATECEAVPREAHGPEEQHMRVLHVPLADALAMVDDGRIRNAATIVGLLATERRLRS